MENLSIALQDYKEIIGSLASVVTIGQFFSGSFICKDIYKKGNTDGISSNPFVGGIVIGVLMLQYSLMLNDTAMLVVNAAAIFLNIIYLLVYIFYTKSKHELFQSMGIGTILTAILITYTKIENENLVEYRFGLIVTILMLALIGSPLLEVREVITNKNSSHIPFPIVLCGTIVSFLWLLYGIILLNEFMIVQNIIGLILCVIQVTLCFIYPNKDVLKKVD